MTAEEVSKIPFRCVCCTAWEDEHTMTFLALEGRLGFCIHNPRNEDGTFFKRGYTHYRIDSKVYKSKKKFLEALKDFNPIRVAYKEPDKMENCMFVEFNKD